MSYSIQEHQHRYASWAAGRAASTKTCRFRVKVAKEIIEELGLHKLITSPDLLPDSTNIDSSHKAWRESAVIIAKEKGLNEFTHGIAAKLINIYLKGIFVCGGHAAHPNVEAIHPPIDSLLLEELYKNNVGGLKQEWNIARKIRWSKFDSNQYEYVINLIRMTSNGLPLWKIESYWCGHQ